MANNTKEKTFSELFQRYYIPFCLYAKRFIDDRDLREDLVSEVFTTLWDKIEHDEIQSDTVVAYLRVSVQNACLNHLKHARYVQDYAEQWAIRAPLYEETPDTLYTEETLWQLLLKTLNKLPSEYRKAFIDSYYHGKTHTEIAAEMEISVKSVNRYKQKAITLLRNELKEWMPLIAMVLGMKL
jgi:RNA polymerase sigma-70 factor (ECF subfamily)